MAAVMRRKRPSFTILLVFCGIMCIYIYIYICVGVVFFLLLLSFLLWTFLYSFDGDLRTTVGNSNRFGHRRDFSDPLLPGTESRLQTPDLKVKQGFLSSQEFFLRVW